MNSRNIVGINNNTDLDHNTNSIFSQSTITRMSKEVRSQVIMVSSTSIGEEDTDIIEVNKKTSKKIANTDQEFTYLDYEISKSTTLGTPEKLEGILADYPVGMQNEILKLNRLIQNYLFFKNKKILSLEVKEIYLNDGQYSDEYEVTILLNYIIGGLHSVQKLLNLETNVLLYLLKTTAVNYKQDLSSILTIKLSKP